MFAVVAPVNDAAAVVDALLLAAQIERLRNPDLSGRYTALADQIGDALDATPAAPAWEPVEVDPEQLHAALRRRVPSLGSHLRIAPG